MRRDTLSSSLFVAVFLIRPLQVGSSLYSRVLEAIRPQPIAVSRATPSRVGVPIYFRDDVPHARLSNRNLLPLVGVGVGNIKNDTTVLEMVAEAMQDDMKSRLFDTTHVSGNEGFVAEGINQGVMDLYGVGGEGKVVVNVITKVWYTHLGYARTVRSVEESIKSLKPALDNDKVDLQIHIMLNWPRCFDNVPWMKCDLEEQNLPADVRDLGPDPNQDRDNAWKESWKALEDLYLSKELPIASIGLANFNIQDIELLDDFARIHPHILQVSVWSLLYDKYILRYCHRHDIHLHAYNTLQTTLRKPERAPRAFHHVQKVANEMSNVTDLDVGFSPYQVILAWLIQHGVTVTPRTTNLSHLADNSALSLINLPAFTDDQAETVAHSVEAYLSGKDLKQDIHVTVQFHAVTQDMVLYWIGGDGEETRIKLIRKGEKFHETTYPNHKFRTYLATNKDVFLEHQITAEFGEHREIPVEL